jgi:transportin-1
MSISLPISPPPSLTSWSPIPSFLSQVLNVLRDPTEFTANSHYDLLQQLNSHPEFDLYLCYIFSALKDEHINIRSRAGLQLKNHIKSVWNNFSPPVKEFIKFSILQTMGDKENFIRSVVGSIVSTIASKEGLVNWPQLLPLLIEMINSNLLVYQEGAFNSLAKLCEDIPFQLDSEALNHPINSLMPIILQYFVHQSADLRKYAISSATAFFHSNYVPEALNAHMDTFMNNLFSLASRDTSREVKQKVCFSFSFLIEHRPELLQPQLENIIRFMLDANRDPEPTVALDACEFWAPYCEQGEAQLELLKKYLPLLIETLLKSMVYSDLDLAIMGAAEEEENENIPDREEDIRPRFHSARVAGDGGESDEEEVDDDDWDDEDATAWNLRKCSASSLDKLAVVYRDGILASLLPLLSQALSARGATKNEDEEKWLVRESGILALGAIAEGCFDGLQPHLPQLIPYLTSLLNDPRPLVRSITCWTLSRYSKWIMIDPVDDKYFKPLMMEFLKRILDKNKKVQEAACSAFATLEDAARERLLPFLKGILDSLMFAFNRYQAKNMLILYDAISTLAESVGDALNQQDYLAILMPPLFNKWNHITDDDRNLLPLLECLTSIAQALGMGFARYSEKVFARCVQLMDRTLKQQAVYQAATQSGSPSQIEPPDKEFIVCSLDLLSGLTEALGANVQALVDQTPNLLQLLFACVHDPDPEVRQSAFALLGDMAKSCLGVLAPLIGNFIPIATRNLNPEFPSVCNNAGWAIAEIAIRVGHDPIAPFADAIMDCLVSILTAEEVPQSLAENISITLGRLGSVVPASVAKRLSEYSLPWFSFLRPIRESNEKLQALYGVCVVVQTNPQAVLTCFGVFLGVLTSFGQREIELMSRIYQLLQAFKSSLGASWTAAFSLADEATQLHIQTLYKL